MARRPAIMLYKGDWKRDPELSMCSPATRGIWIDLVCDMDDLECPTLTGTAVQLARCCRASDREVTIALRELQATKAANVTELNGVFTVTSRRVEKDLELSKTRSKAVQTRYKTPTNTPSNNLQNAEDANASAIENAVAPKKLFTPTPKPKQVGLGSTMSPEAELANRRMFLSKALAKIENAETLTTMDTQLIAEYRAGKLLPEEVA